MIKNMELARMGAVNSVNVFFQVFNLNKGHHILWESKKFSVEYSQSNTTILHSRIMTNDNEALGNSNKITRYNSKISNTPGKIISDII